MQKITIYNREKNEYIREKNMVDEFERAAEIPMESMNQMNQWNQFVSKGSCNPTENFFIQTFRRLKDAAFFTEQTKKNWYKRKQ